jgi:hypothetical protein
MDEVKLRAWLHEISGISGLLSCLSEAPDEDLTLDPGHALPPARPSTGPARHVPGPVRGLGPERAERVTLREIHPGGLCPIQFMAPILILTRVSIRDWR